MVCLDNMNKKSELLSSGVSLSCSEYWCIIFQCAPRMIRTGLQHGLQTSLLHSYILPLHTLHRIQQQFSPRPEKNCKQNCCFLSISREDTIACFNLGDKPVWYDRIEFFLAMACCPVYGARSSCSSCCLIATSAHTFVLVLKCTCEVVVCFFDTTRSSSSLFCRFFIHLQNLAWLLNQHVNNHTHAIEDLKGPCWN